jgi:hypothetical protein
MMITQWLNSFACHRRLWISVESDFYDNSVSNVDIMLIASFLISPFSLRFDTKKLIGPMGTTSYCKLERCRYADAN